MKSINLIAQAAYTAFMARQGIAPMPWKDLPQSQREGWIAAVNTVREEIAAVH